ncbi:hypothetical protein BCR37DRAFT_384494 [Protomyces lactucae-debilis]|uniref:Retrovirus-related Pol polyprotein from transposon TNT 1-94-like beta-barrel domain-containing protein n=1 Tax=Protomyces lactucae-debilis TaxID=2754530 RepID=A0A1Y2ES02_PROLT|nr:uncharacterized protein BCR37DRAFT_384494 [Protomyces lactucae-debilis]ORY74370.1 hypothetical protein BCR37DRAFT_384494 [Protomyces lactucae-debilis]
MSSPAGSSADMPGHEPPLGQEPPFGQEPPIGQEPPTAALEPYMQQKLLQMEQSNKLLSEQVSTLLKHIGGPSTQQSLVQKQLWSILPEPSITLLMPSRDLMKSSLETVAKLTLESDGSNWYEFVTRVLQTMRSSGTNSAIAFPTSSRVELFSKLDNNPGLIELHNRWHAAVVTSAWQCTAVVGEDTLWGCMECFAPDASHWDAIRRQFASIKCRTWSEVDVKRYLKEVDELCKDALATGHDPKTNELGQLISWVLQGLPRNEMTSNIILLVRDRIGGFTTYSSFVKYIVGSAVALRDHYPTQSANLTTMAGRHAVKPSRPFSPEHGWWHPVAGGYCDEVGHSMKECFSNPKGANYRSKTAHCLSRTLHINLMRDSLSVDPESPFTNEYTIDSGANQHLTDSRADLTSFVNARIKVQFADHSTAYTEGYGKLTMKVRDSDGQTRTITLDQVFCAPWARVKLTTWRDRTYRRRQEA